MITATTTRTPLRTSVDGRPIASARRAAGSDESGIEAKVIMYTPITRPWYSGGVWLIRSVLLMEVYAAEAPPTSASSGSATP